MNKRDNAAETFLRALGFDPYHVVRFEATPRDVRVTVFTDGKAVVDKDPDSPTRGQLLTTTYFIRSDLQRYEVRQAPTPSEEDHLITALVREGFTWESAVAAVGASDWSLLEHSGLFYVVSAGADPTTSEGSE